MSDTAPTRIWLNDGGDFSAASGHEDGVTWCVHRVDDGDSEYILASEHAAQLADAQTAMAMVVEQAAAVAAGEVAAHGEAHLAPFVRRAILALAPASGVETLAKLRARAERADEHRLGRQAMHRRAQKAEGKSLRSIALLDLIIAKIKDVIPVLPTLPSPYPLSLNTLYHQLHAVRRHAKNSSGAAFGVQFSYCQEWLKKERTRAIAAEADRDRLAAANAVLEAKVAGLVDFVDDFAKAKIDALRYSPPYGSSPDDEPDPVVDAETVWAWQADARADLATQEAGNG